MAVGRPPRKEAPRLMAGGFVVLATGLQLSHTLVQRGKGRGCVGGVLTQLIAKTHNRSSVLGNCRDEVMKLRQTLGTHGQ